VEVRERLAFNGHDVFLIPSDNNTFLLYAPTLKKLLRIRRGVAEWLTRYGISGAAAHPAASRVALLLQRMLSEAAQPIATPLTESRFFHLALGLTKDCTLRCLYCHANAGDRDAMPREVLEGAVQHAFERAGGKGLRGVNVSFAVGGEPTTDWSLFAFCVGLLRRSSERYGAPVHLSMTTNGYYGELQRQFIVEHFDNILLSLDGPPEIQNLQRPTKAGADSYSVVRHSARAFSRSARSFAIRATVSDRSVDEMAEIVRFFVAEFGNRYDLVFEPLVLLGRAQANQAIVSEPAKEAFVREYIRAKEVGKAFGLKVTTSAANHKRLVSSFCGAMAFPSFTVTTGGLVTTCERDSDGSSYWYGEFCPETGRFTVDQARVERNRLLLVMPEKCGECFCRWHCAGDCPDLREIGYDRCYVNRKLVQYELECLLRGEREGESDGGQAYE